MNKEFEQWREQTFTLTVIGRDMINKVYNHLQANPHLLREDGEWTKEDLKEYAEFSNPRPTDEPVLATYTEPISGQNMEQEAREMFSKYLDMAWDANGHSQEMMWKDDAITALTEFGKMWYERGREEKAIEWSDKEIFQLQQQLAEKDKELEWYKQKLLLWESNHEKGALATLFLERESELTAAKEQIAKIEQQNADMQRKNL